MGAGHLCHVLPFSVPTVSRSSASMTNRTHLCLAQSPAKSVSGVHVTHRVIGLPMPAHAKREGGTPRDPGPRLAEMARRKGRLGGWVWWLGVYICVGGANGGWC